MAFWNLKRRNQVKPITQVASERLSQDDWAQMMANYFSFNGNSYPITGFTYAGSNKETVPNDFESYTLQAYKGDSIVFSAMWARALLFSEMRFTYQHLDDGRPGDFFHDPGLRLLEEPWPNGTTGEFNIRALQDADLAGNFYVVKEVDPKTRVERVRRLRPDWVDIVLTAPPDKARKSDVAGYIYKPGNSPNPDDWETFPIDGSKGAIAHWSPIPDPEAQYRGMSPLTPILTEILVDKGATNHKKKFFEQGATPQLAVSFKDPESLGMTPEQFQDFIREMRLNTEGGVTNAYSTMYLAGGADVTVIGSHLQQLDFRNMQGHVETRLVAALRIHPVLVGLAEAIHGAPLAIGNYQAAKDMFGEMWLRPMWRSLCDSLRGLVPQFENARLWYDDRDVTFLRQDREAQAELINQNAQTMNTLIMAGYTPESAALYITTDGDARVLEHSGLVSVQMYTPGQNPEEGGQGKVNPAARPVPPIPPEPRQGQKSVTPVPKPPKQTKEPQVPKPGSNSYLNKDKT